jgi:Tol biopolymer transport system component
MGGPENSITILNHNHRFGVGLDWSPDGKYLAFSGRPGYEAPGGIFLYSFATGEPHQITFPPTGDPSSYYDLMPVFSPDGNSLAFFRMVAGGGGGGDLYVQPLSDGEPVGEPALLAAGGGFLWGLDWTAEGDSVVYAHGPTELYSYLSIVPLQGGAPSRLLVGERARHLSIAREGNRLVYAEQQDDHNIWRIGGPTAEDVGTPVKMFSSTLDDWGPAYSPEGDRVAFISDRSGGGEVWVASADGSDPQKLTDFGHATLPQWHPDGDRLAFTSCFDGLCSLYVVSAKGGVPTKFPDSEFEDSHPTYSADGNWIYFQSARAGGPPWEIWKMPSSGEGAPVQITAGRDLMPRYQADRVYVWRRTNESIWSVAPDGGDEKMVLDTAIGWLNWQVWRDKIIYLRGTSTTTPALEIFDLATGRTQVHTTLELSPLAAAGRALNAYPFDGLAISPDGQYILFSRLDTAGSDLMLVDNYRQE